MSGVKSYAVGNGDMFYIDVDGKQVHIYTENDYEVTYL
jgi:hypothetical protein